MENWSHTIFLESIELTEHIKNVGDERTATRQEEGSMLMWERIGGGGSRKIGPNVRD